ncbi:Hypothetical_protein [Hexamita inflata]|uniref:Hypothetical_protein n=1 Tax=Hexamita inflata TaxID=28002 RepID=A0AA86PFM9_9EUKA|nr:Hypothetical protein HINF_LOCUS22539 [Hexamita inflata]
MGNICHEPEDQEFWGEEYQENIYTEVPEIQQNLPEIIPLKFKFGENSDIDTELSLDDYILEQDTDYIQKMNLATSLSRNSSNIINFHEQYGFEPEFQLDERDSYPLKTQSSMSFLSSVDNYSDLFSHLGVHEDQLKFIPNLKGIQGE